MAPDYLLLLLSQSQYRSFICYYNLALAGFTMCNQMHCLTIVGVCLFVQQLLKLQSNRERADGRTNKVVSLCSTKNQQKNTKNNVKHCTSSGNQQQLHISLAANAYTLFGSFGVFVFLECLRWGGRPQPQNDCNVKATGDQSLKTGNGYIFIHYG